MTEAIPTYPSLNDLPTDGSVLMAFAETDPFGNSFTTDAVEPNNQPGTPWHGHPIGIGSVPIQRRLFYFNGSGHHHHSFSRLVSDGVYEYGFSPPSWVMVTN